MEDTKDILATLIGQHRSLQDDLSLAINESDSMKIEKYLKNFSADLDEHLRLENDLFYTELLKKMRTIGRDTNDTEKFIAKMSEIGKTIMSFLEKYETADLIQSQINNFKTELGSIIETLNIRIEAEESGVYLYWK